jgi:hypothetical protein
LLQNLEDNMKLLPIGIALLLGWPLLVSGAVRGNEVMYVSGSLRDVAENTEGKLDVSGQLGMMFTAKKSSTAIPYKGIASLYYGEKAGRRAAVAPAALLAKKRRHYLTVTFVDGAGLNQYAVFELAKGIVSSVVTGLETRSGKRLTFDSEETRKQFEKETK